MWGKIRSVVLLWRHADFLRFVTYAAGTVGIGRALDRVVADFVRAAELVGFAIGVAGALFGAVTKAVVGAKQGVPGAWLVGIAAHITETVGGTDATRRTVGSGLAEVGAGIGEGIAVSSVGTVRVGGTGGQFFALSFFADVSVATIHITAASQSAGAGDADFVTWAVGVG